MFLKKIELKGFKSFADRTLVDFSEGITCVVGPNGSGKSNITDAFRWVLGEQRFKTLRGSQMQDVIFNGTNKRKALGFAEVAITFDNESGFLPVPYTEVTVMRRLYRSGESEYAINENKCRLKDVKELFMDTGVGVEGYSIIGQGRIESILSTNKDERRLIFEEAAGIVKYRYRKEEAQRKLDRTLVNLERIEDIVVELEQRVGPLKEQSEKAKAYKTLSDELKGLEINLFLHELERVDASLKDINDEMAVKSLENNDKRVKLEALLDQQMACEEEVNALNRHYEGLRQRQVDASRDLMRVEGEVNVLIERRTMIEGNVKTLTEDSDDDAQNLLRAKTLRDEAKEKWESQADAYEQAKKDLEEAQTSLLDQNDRMASLKQKIDTLHEKLRNNQNRVTEEKLTLHSESTQIEMLKKQELALHDECASFDDVQNEALKDLGLAQKEVSAHEGQVVTLQHEKKAMQDDIITRQNDLTSLEKDIFSARSDLSDKQAKLNALQDQEANQEGFAFSVKQVMQWSENDNKVLGTIKDLFTVDETYEVAFETALGRNIQNIVVTDESVVDPYIEQLKREKAGRATFMPVAQLEPKIITDLPHGKGFVGPAMALLTCEKHVEPALQYLLFNVFIAETLEDAKHYAKKLPKGARVISLAGEIVNVGGAITGGSLSKRETGFLKRKRDIEDLIEALEASEKNLVKMQNLRASHLQEIEDDRLKIQAIDEQVGHIQTALNDLVRQRDTIRNTILQATQNKSKSVDQSEAIASDLLRLKTSMASREALLLTLQTSIKDEKASVAQAESALEIDTRAMAKVQEALTETKIVHARLEESAKAAEADYKDKSERLKDLARINDRRLYDITRLTDQAAQLAEAIIEGQAHIKSLKHAALTSENEMADQQAIIDEKRLKLQGYAFEIEHLRNIVSSHNDVLFKLELQKTKLDTRRENVMDNLWQKYELSHAEAMDYWCEFDHQDYSRQAKKLKTEIKALGEVNLGAIKEYEVVAERFEFLTEQKADLLASTGELKKLIKDMDRQMRASFKDKLEEINGYFKETFSSLFGGGFGEITAHGDEDILEAEIVINAQPPGKKLQSLELMSGGEKAFTAIALLFAILKTKPSPFCILDEIEAALDDVNIFRFADFLQDFVKNSQFIIITHRKGTMEIAKSLYGVTMQEQGISTVLSVKLEDAENHFIDVV